MKTLQEKLEILRNRAEIIRENAGLPDSIKWRMFLENAFFDWSFQIENNFCSPRDFLDFVADNINLMLSETA